MKYVLGIETSCDDTSVAIVDNNGNVIAMAMASQDQFHKPFGGVVPEIASRNHTHNLLLLVEDVLEQSKLTWEKIDGIAVTNRPGLLGSLLVGVVTAKTFAYSFKKPMVGVHHLEGHIVAPFLKDAKHGSPQMWNEPFLSLVVSGGHTAIYLVNEFANKYQTIGTTIDDAAGEAFDKFAKIIELGYPGGALVDKEAKKGNAKAFQFPRGLIKENNFDFSFSGLKTSAQNIVNKLNVEERTLQKANLCASYQEAIVDVLATKFQNASQSLNIKKLVITGGVSANSRLREVMQAWSQKENVDLVMPPLRYCTDNAAMIAFAGLKRLEMNERAPLDLGVFARADLC